jgi:epoxyqueuosine reductase QueG
VSLLEWLEAPDEELRECYDRLYFPRNDPRYLRRNALVAAGNSDTASLLDAVDRFRDDEDELLSEHARWAADRLRS